MKNKVIAEYEDKRWYRVVKSLYVFFFGLFLLIANTALYYSFDFGSFVITNVVIVFSMGAVEGLFWYIVRGKWGYPKNEEVNKEV